jgi:excisionase family DNA binding protein
MGIEMPVVQDRPQNSNEVQVSLEYLTVQEVAECLKVSPKSVFRWAKKDPSMPALRIGGCVRFPRERLLRWLKAREQGNGRSKQPEKLWPSQPEPVETQAKPLPVTAPCAQA